MRFDCGLTIGERIDAWLKARDDAKREWHGKFAWLITRVADDDGKEICVWLEWYERRLEDRHSSDFGLYTVVNRRVIQTPNYYY